MGERLAGFTTTGRNGGPREANRDLAPTELRSGNSHRTGVRFGHRLDYRETEPVTVLTTARPPEPAENRVIQLRGNPGTRVVNVDQQVPGTGVDLGRKLNRRAGARCADCIVDQIEQGAS